MKTALDLPAKSLDPDEARVVEQVREHGWFDTHVFGDDEGPCFSYSLGFGQLGAPDVIVFSLDRQKAHDILWEVYRKTEGGRQILVGAPVSDVVQGRDVYFMPIDPKHYRDYLGWAIWFYRGQGFPCVQLVWPDRAGRFPWHDDFALEFANSQPDLSPKGWRSALKFS